MILSMIPLMRRASPGSNCRKRTRDGSGLSTVLERFRGIASAVPFPIGVPFPMVRVKYNEQL